MQQDMQFILETPTLFSIKSTQTDFLLHQQESQEVAINWHVTLDNQALILVFQQEHQTEITLALEQPQPAHWHHVKIPFVNQLDKLERGQMEIFNQVAMSQSFQIVMMEMFVLSILATRHG